MNMHWRDTIVRGEQRAIADTPYWLQHVRAAHAVTFMLMPPHARSPLGVEFAHCTAAEVNVYILRGDVIRDAGPCLSPLSCAAVRQAGINECVLAADVRTCIKE